MSCGLRFGDREKPYKVSQRSRDEWLDLIKTMLPAPIETNDAGELIAGEPAVVMVRVDENVIAIMEASLEWDGPHDAHLTGRPFAQVPLRTSARRVAELIARAWGKRISRYCWCVRCRHRVLPECLTFGLCDGCAAGVLGVVH